jgi:sugar phosphate isomerase/epimerase
MYVSSACLAAYTDIVSLVKHLCRIGLNRVELGSGSKTRPGFLEQLRAYACGYLIHNYFPPPDEPFVINLASTNPIIQQRSLNLVQQAIELSAELGAPFYSVHAGFITDPHTFGGTHFLFPSPTESDAAQHALDRFVSNLLMVDQFAQEHKVGLLVENNVCWADLRGKLLLQTADEFVDFFEMLNSQNVGVLLDFGHLNVSACTLGFNRLDFIRRLTPYIRAFHVHDNDGRNDSHQPVKSGSWVLDVLRRPEFADLQIVLEAKFESLTDLRVHVDWLQDRIGRG